MGRVVGEVCGGTGEVRRGQQEGRVTGQQGLEWVRHGQMLHRAGLKHLKTKKKEHSAKSPHHHHSKMNVTETQKHSPGVGRCRQDSAVR